MATVRIAYVTQFVAATLARLQTTDKHSALNRIENMNSGINSSAGRGVPATVNVIVDQNAVAATGTVTLASVSNNDTVTIGDQVLTAKTSSPSGANQWLVGVTDTADAAALVVIINAHTTLSQYVLASSALGVVTLTAITTALGVLGNAIIFSSSNGSRLAVVAMSGGVNDTGAKTYAF